MTRPILSVEDVHVSLGGAQILQGVTLQVGRRPLALIGRNGMGKTTLCRSIMGDVALSSGSVVLDGSDLTGRSPDWIARAGIAWVPQGRRMFPSLSVHEHLLLTSRGSQVPWTIERAYATFPRLAERRANRGHQLSGGEQQMLAIARALLQNPRILVLDEPTEGLAPLIVDRLISLFQDLSTDGMAILLVEQNLRVATTVADTVAVMVSGRIAATVSAESLAADPALQQLYLGVGSGKTPSPLAHQTV